MNDVQHAVPKATLKLFADDTNLFLYNSDHVNRFATANVNMVLLSAWFIANRLSLNLNKTCYRVFGPKNKDNTVLNLYMGTHEVQKDTML